MSIFSGLKQMKTVSTDFYILFMMSSVREIDYCFTGHLLQGPFHGSAHVQAITLTILVYFLAYKTTWCGFMMNSSGNLFQGNFSKKISR